MSSLPHWEPFEEKAMFYLLLSPQDLAQDLVHAKRIILNELEFSLDLPHGGGKMAESPGH